MAALDFPDAPTNGQVFDKWTWNGTQWVLTAGPPGTPDLGGTWRKGLAGLAVPNGAYTAVPWDVEDSDSSNMVTLNNPTVTIPANGIWAITAWANNTTSATGRQFLAIDMAAGGWATSNGASYRATNGGQEGIWTVSATVRLNAGQTFQVMIYQQSGAAATMVFSLQCHRVGVV